MELYTMYCLGVRGTIHCNEMFQYKTKHLSLINKLCKHMMPSESCLATQTTSGMSISTFGAARYFPDNSVPANVFQPIEFGEAGLPPIPPIPLRGGAMVVDFEVLSY